MAFKVDTEGNPILDNEGNKIPLDPTPPVGENKSGDEGGSEALKRQIEDLKDKVKSLEQDIDLKKVENERLEAFKDKVLDEKRAEAEKRKSLEALLDGNTPEQVQIALKAYKNDNGEREEEIQTIVRSRVKEIREQELEPLKRELQEERVKKENLRQKLASAVVVKEILENAQLHGVRDDALELVEMSFRERVGVNQNGDKVYYNVDGHETDKINWEIEMINLREKRPFLFDKNRGSTANASLGTDGVVNGKNPWKKEEVNYSEQLRIQSENPNLAERLKQEAGIKV